MDSIYCRDMFIVEAVHYHEIIGNFIKIFPNNFLEHLFKRYQDSLSFAVDKIFSNRKKRHA